MKKFLSILLILVLCLSLAACGSEEPPAEEPDEGIETENGGIEGSGDGEGGSSQETEESETPEEPADSKSREDMSDFEVHAEGMSGDGYFIRPVRKDEEKEYKELLETCEEEIKLLSDSESYEKYFGEEIKEYDNDELEDVEYKELIEDGLDDVKLGECHIFEYCPIIAGGFEEGCGEVEAQMLFAAPYEKDEDVVVMIGIVTEHEDGTRTIEWYAFQGEGMELNSDIPEAEGRIKVEFPEEMVLLIQERSAMLAIISD